MKLRIKGNSLRLRLSQSEVDQIGKGKTVRVQTSFGFDPGQVMTYALSPSPSMETVKVAYQHGNIMVWLPQEIAHDWVHTEQVSVEASQKINQEDHLHILIEKDFRCLNPRANENESDNFPHPKENTLAC